MNRFESVLPEPLVGKLWRIRREHEERGCGVFGRCDCTCPDHPCSGEPFDEPLCPRCKGAGILTEPGYVPLGKVPRRYPCPDCDYGEFILAPDFPWEWAKEATMASLAPEVRQGVSRWTTTARLPFLLFYGKTGRGKSWAAAAAARPLIRLGMQVRWFTMSGLLEALKANMGKPADERTDVLGLARSVEVLVLDDFGRQRQSDWSVAEVFELVGSRYERRRTTIITTNLDPSASGDALWGRLTDAALAVVVKVDGPDRRRTR